MIAICNFASFQPAAVEHAIPVEPGVWHKTLSRYAGSADHFRTGSAISPVIATLGPQHRIGSIAKEKSVKTSGYSALNKQ